MTTRKMLLMGTLFTTLLNVSTLGAWADSPTVKVVASAKRATGTTKPSLTRVAFFAATPSDADSGCSATVVDSTVDQQVGGVDQQVVQKKTPCDLAKDYTASVQKVLDEAQIAVDKAALIFSNAYDASDAAAKDPTTTDETKAALKASLDLASRHLDDLTKIVFSAFHALQRAKADEAEACAKKPAVDPNPLLEIEEPLDQLFKSESTADLSGAFS
jgi:hypothetical protein